MIGGILSKKKLILAIAAVLLVLCAGIKPAMSYFTTYVTAKGSKTIQLGNETSVEEPQVVDGVKHVVIESKEGSDPVYVRAIAYVGEKYKDYLSYSSASGEDGESGKWSYEESKDGGYYYYSDILYGGKTTNELLITIENFPEDVDDFNVIVIYESTPVLYDSDGNPYADWTQKVVVNSEEGGLN